jgi:hypothetical protein
MNDTNYPGLLDDHDGGLTHLGRIVMDGWVFGLIPETQTCSGWAAAQMQELADRVSQAWAPHGHLPSRLPAQLRERHAQIYGAALERARAAGWNPELDDD